MPRSQEPTVFQARSDEDAALIVKGYDADTPPRIELQGHDGEVLGSLNVETLGTPTEIPLTPDADDLTAALIAAFPNVFTQAEV